MKLSVAPDVYEAAMLLRAQLLSPQPERPAHPVRMPPVWRPGMTAAEREALVGPLDRLFCLVHADLLEAQTAAYEAELVAAGVQPAWMPDHEWVALQQSVARRHAEGTQA